MALIHVKLDTKFPVKASCFNWTMQCRTIPFKTYESLFSTILKCLKSLWAFVHNRKMQSPAFHGKKMGSIVQNRPLRPKNQTKFDTDYRCAVRLLSTIRITRESFCRFYCIHSWIYKERNLSVRSTTMVER